MRSGYGLVWIELAGITTPFINPQFPFLQTVTQRTLDNLTPAFTLAQGPSVAATSDNSRRGPRSGRIHWSIATSAPATRSSGTLAVQRAITRTLSFEIAYVGPKITHIGLPDTNITQLTVEQLALGSRAHAAGAESVLRQIPASSSHRRPHDSTRAVDRSRSRCFTTVSFYRNNVGDSNYHGVQMKLEQRFSAGLSALVAYTRSKLMDDASSVFDATVLTGPVANFPVADSFNRALERDLSTGDIPHVFVGSVVWQVPIGTSGSGRKYQPGGIAGALLADWDIAAIVTRQSGIPLAVTQATNFNAFAGFGTQRPNRVGDPEPAVARSRRPRAGSTRTRSRSRRSSRWGTARAIRCAGRATRTSIWRSRGASRCRTRSRAAIARRWSCGWKRST